MFRTLIIAIMTLAMTVSCASKKKAVEEQAGAAGGGEPAIANQEIGFDPTGSDSGKIPGLHTVYFDYDQDALTADAKTKLKDNAEWIKKNAKMTIQIEGHTDERGSVEYNLSLGDRRAKAVKNYLTSLGIDGKRMTVISYGEEKLLEPKKDEHTFSRNRRANFVPLPQ